MNREEYISILELENAELKKENKRLYELCMYSLISTTKIYNHELANDTKQAFIKIIRDNLEEDSNTIRSKIKDYWYKG